jgi:hypothetical protein
LCIIGILIYFISIIIVFSVWCICNCFNILFHIDKKFLITNNYYNSNE